MDVSSFIDNALGVTPNKQLSPYDDLIEESASRHDVDPDFIRAVMGTESAFNPKAKSPKDAHGLMQLIPGTARRMGVKNIYDPKENIEGGTKYLKQLLDMFDGDVNLALAGYNAGEGAVQKYGNKIPPYKETRKYVKQITGNYQGSGYHPTKVANSFIDGVLGGDTPAIDPANNFIDSVLADEDTSTIYGQPAHAYNEPPPPALETDDTILAQLKVASDPTKPRKGVFFPENDTERALQIAQSLDQKEWGLFPDKQNKGYQLVHLPSAKKLKLRSATDIQTYIDKNPNALVTLTSKAYNAGRNTGDNQQTVSTIDPHTGTELTSSVVTPETRDAQIALDKANHPEGVSVDTTTNAVVAKRLSETGEELLDPNVIANAQPMANQAARQPLEDMSQLGIAPAMRPSVTKPVGKRQKVGQTSNAQTPEQDTSSVSVSLDPNDFTVDGQKVTDFQPATREKGGEGYVPKEVGKENDNLKGIAYVFRADPNLSERDAAKAALEAAAKANGVTFNFDQYEKSRNGKPLFPTGYQSGDQIQVDYQALKDGGADIDIRTQQVQNRDKLDASVGTRPFGYKTEAEAEKELDKRIKEPDYAAQEIASDALGDLLKSPQTAAKKLGWAIGNYWNSDDVPAPSETWVKSEKDRLLKQHGNLSKAWSAEQYYQNADLLEKGIRFANQTSRSFVKNLVGGTVKSVLFIDNLLEPLGVNALLPEKAKISIRNAANVADFFVRAMQGDTSAKDWQNSDTELDKTTLFKAIKEFDKAVGDDPVLKGRLLGAGGDAFGSALSFVAMAALMPSLKTTNFWGNVRNWDTAIAGAVQSAGSGYEEGKNSKLPETQAKVYGVIQGLLGTTEALGAGAELAHLLKNDGMKTIRAKLAEGILEVARHGYREGKQEFGQEVFQTTSGKIALEYLKDNDPSLIQKLTNVLDRLPKQFRDTVTNEGLIALVTGGTMGAGTKAATTTISKDLESDGQGDSKSKGTANIPVAATEVQAMDEVVDEPVAEKPKPKKVTLEPVEDKSDKVETIEQVTETANTSPIRERAKREAAGLVGEDVVEGKKPQPLSNTQIEFSPEQAKPFDDFRKNIIDPKDIADKSVLPEYAKDGIFEIEPHVTVKYGLHTNKHDDVMPMLKGEKPIEVELGKTSVFKGSDKKIPGTDNPVPYDVVIVEVKSPDLERLNKKLTDGSKNTTTFPYSPHATLAYVKSGEGEKYAGKTDFEGQKFTFNGVTFSPADKSGKKVIPLTQSPAPAKVGEQGAKEPAVVEGEAAKGDVVRDFVLPNAKVTRPLADKGLTSYRYRTDSGGHVAIGAKDNTDALNEAGRSITGKPDVAKLDVWNGTEYVPVTPTTPDTATLKALRKLGYTPAFAKTLSADERARILDEGIVKGEYKVEAKPKRLTRAQKYDADRQEVIEKLRNTDFDGKDEVYISAQMRGSNGSLINTSTVIKEAGLEDGSSLNKYRKAKSEPLRSVPDIIDSKGINYERAKDVAGRIERGEAEIRRLNPAGERGRVAGGKRAIESSLILSSSERASEESGSRTRPVERQERVLEEYAKREGIWIDPDKFSPQDLVGKGMEARVYNADAGKSVVKVVDYKQIDKNATPLDFIDNRIAAFNQLFPETAYELVGFTRTKDGFRFVIKQPLIRDAVYTTAAERQAFMKSKGFEMVDRYGEEFANKFYHVRDLHEKNALIKSDGTILVIDAVTTAKPIGNYEVVEKGEALRSTPEIDAVELVKDKDGNLLAPNGKKSNLNERNWREVRTPSFIKYFGDWINDPENASKVVDENGEPLPSFHGTEMTFTEFRADVGHVNDRGFYGKGFYFTFNPNIKWQEAAKGEASYYGSKVMEAFLNARTPFDFSKLSEYKGVSNHYMSYEPLIFLRNIAEQFPDVAKNITVNKIGEWVDGEAPITDVPITVLPKLFKKYDNQVKIVDVYDGDEITGRVAYTKEETVNYTDAEGKEHSWVRQDTFGRYSVETPDATVRQMAIIDAIEKYEGIEASYHPEGYMTRNPEITEAIKAAGHDSIWQSPSGDEIVVFKPNQIKSATNNSGNFDPNEDSILKKVRTTEDSAELKQLAKSRNFSTDIVPHLKVSIDKGQFGKSILSLDNNQTVEFARTLLAITSDVARDEMTAIDGLFLDPQQVANIRDAALGVQDAFADKGKDTKPIEAFVKALDKAASVNGTVQLEAFENARGHETGHAASYLGAKEKALINRRSGLKELADTDPKFAGAFNKWAKIEGRAWTAKNATPAQLAHGAEEVATYIADGQHSRLGLSYAQGIKLGVELQLRYAQARIDEGAANVAEALSIFDGTIFEQYKEAINEREQSNQSDQSNVESKGAGQDNEYQGRDPGTKESDGDGVSSVGAEFTPGGEEKLSKTPSTLRKGGIPVQERLYTSTTDAERQSFANERMDDGLDAAMKWTRDQLDTKNNNAGATGVVGVNVMMQLGKEGRIAELNKFAEDLLPAYTDSAQMIQSLAVVSMFSPDTAGAYVTKVAKQNGQDVTPEQVEKALDIAGRMSEVVQADGISEAALNEATAENEQLKKDIADLEEALGLANDKNKEFKGKLSGQGRTIAALRRQIEGEDRGKTRLPGAVRKHVKEITERKDDILERLKQKYGGNPILQMVAPNSQANFDEWFGDSKVVDENGNPLVVYRGEAEENAILQGEFFTDSISDASAYAELAALSQAVESNEELSEIVNDILAEEGGESLTDLGPKTIRDIADANGIDLPKKVGGHVSDVYLKIENPLDLTEFGSDVGDVKELWNDLHKQGLLDESWNDLDEESQYDIERDYENMALYRFLETEGIQAKAFENGFDGVIFVDMSPDGKKTHTTWLTKTKPQAKSATNNSGEYSDKNDSILRSTPNELDQDAVDAATYHLSKNLGKQTPTQVKDAINVLTNGQLTKQQIDDVYAAAVSSLRLERSAMDADTKAANKLRQSHYREADKINDAKLTDWEKKLNKADSKFVNTTVREGVENGYTDEAIWFALARKHYPNVNDALKALREEFPDADQRNIIRDSERLTQAVKRRLIGDIAQRQNEFSLNETDIDLIKEERRVNTHEKQKVVREANRFYSGMVKDAGEIILDTIVNFRRANLLTAVKTHFVNIGGNVGFAMGEEIARAPSTVVDLAASIFTGERTTALSPYAIGNGLKALVSQDETLKNSKWDTPEGKERGITAAKHVLQYGGSIADMERLQHSESILSAKFENRPAGWMDNYINGVFKLLGAEDAFFKVYAFRRHIEEQARAIALTERRKDKNVNVKERTKELVQNPTNVMQVQADRYAHFMTFQNDNALSEFIASIKRGRPKTKAAVETIMPYDRTPTNIVMRVLEYTPVGTVAAPIRWRSAQKAFDRNKPSAMKFRNELTGAVRADLAQSEDFNALPETEKRKIVEATLQKVFTREQQEQFAKTIGRSSLGTGLFSLGFVMAAAGLMAGAMSFDDDDKAESNEFEKRKKAGIENGSILTPWGRIVLPKSPATIAMVGGATFYEQMKMSKKSVLMSAVNAGVEAFSDMATELPLINSTYSVVRSLGKGKYGEFTGNIASGFVPASAMVRSISEVTDEKERTGSSYREGEKILTTEDWFRKQGRGLKNSFLKGIPGARNYLVDESTLGVSESERGGVLRRIVRTLDPFNTRSANDYEAPGPPRDYKGELNDLQRQRGATTDAKEKERLTKEIDAILAEQKVNREVAKETKIALGNQSAVQKLKEVGSVDELLKNNSVRYWSTDDWVAVLDSPDLSDADKQLASDALRKKADNASKAKSLTPQELERVQKVLPDYGSKMRKLADLVYGKQGITSDWQINEPDLDAPGDYKVDTIKRPTKPDPRSEPILEAYKKIMWKANYDSTDANNQRADRAGQLLLRRIKNIPLTTAQIEAMEQVNPQMAAALKWKEQRQSQNVIDMRER